MSREAEIIELLHRWSESGSKVALHIIECKLCQKAENGRRSRDYCVECNRLWQEEMGLEHEVMNLIPELNALGIDTEEFCRLIGIKFPNKIC